MNNPRLEQFLKQYGSFPIAYSAVYDDEMHHYEAEEGFVPYADTRHERVILGEPLCAPQDLDALLDKFCADTKKKHRNLVALQCGIEVARNFVKRGYNANQMGVETNLNVPVFSLEGKTMSKVRRWVNSARNAGVTVCEKTMREPETVNAVSAVSQEWLQGKINTGELRLLTRPLKAEYEPDTRLFCAMLNGKIAAFVIFEPIWRGGKVTGYYADFVRALDCAPNGSLDLIYQEAVAKFRTEGVEILSFGLSPLADIEDTEKIHNPIVASIFRLNYSQGNSMYAYQGLDAHKKAYADGVNGFRVPKYMVCAGALPFNQMLNVFRYIGILPEQSYLASIRYFGGFMLKGLFSHEKKASNVLNEMINGVPTEDIAEHSSLSLPDVKGMVDKITGVFRRMSPEIEQQAMFFSGNLNEDTEKLYVKVSNIVDSDREIHFVHNITFIPYKQGYTLLMTVEADPSVTVEKAHKIAQGIRRKIQKKMENIFYVHIEFEPDGSFFQMLNEVSLEKTTPEDLA